MTDNNDQECLNALVDDCYGGLWPWRKYDIGTNQNSIDCGLVPLFLTSQADVDWVNLINIDTPPVGKFYPLAGTWVIGSLIEKMGEAFTAITQTPGGWLCCYKPDLNSGMNHYTEHYPTAIQALCTALRAVLEATNGQST